MKTSRGFSVVACLLIAGAGTLRAAGAGPGQGIGVTGSGATGSVGTAGAASAAGAGRSSGAVAASSSHASGSVSSVRGSGVVLGGGPNGGTRLAGTSRPGGVAYSGTPRYLPGGFTPATSNRAPVVGANTGRAITNPAAAQPNLAAGRTVPMLPAARAHNAWTDSAPTVSGRFPNGAAGLVQNVNNGNERRRENFTGTILYPNAGRGVSGDRRERGPGNHADSSYGRDGFRFHRRSYYTPYCGYGFGYSGVFIGGYDPYFYGGTAAIADAGGDYAGADLGVNVAESSLPSPAAVDALSQPYPGAVMQPPVADPAYEADAPPVQAPAGQGLRSNNGPDSLVEAVQAELSRRGYFGGKIDAIYNEATHTAIQRFQTDQKLPASGRVNEATLHALQLD